MNITQGSIFKADVNIKTQHVRYTGNDTGYNVGSRSGSRCQTRGREINMGPKLDRHSFK